jgi:hypothetical protein
VTIKPQTTEEQDAVSITAGTITPNQTLTVTLTVPLTKTVTLHPTSTPAASPFFGQAPVFPVRDLPVSFNGGVPFTLGTQSGGLTLYFIPPEPLNLFKVRSLSLFLTPAGEAAPLDLYLLFFRYERPEQILSSPGVRLNWGENVLTPPLGYLERNGAFLVRLVNTGLEPLAIEDLRIQLEVE